MGYKSYYDVEKEIEMYKQKYRVLRSKRKPRLSQIELEEIFDGIDYDYDLAKKINEEIVKKHKENIQ